VGNSQITTAGHFPWWALRFAANSSKRDRVRRALGSNRSEFCRSPTLQFKPLRSILVSSLWFLFIAELIGLPQYHFASGHSILV
jgi:hypothetical protein